MIESRPAVWEVADTPPNYRATSGLLLTACREFYKDPEHERAYQEWKKTRKEESA